MQNKCGNARIVALFCSNTLNYAKLFLFIYMYVAATNNKRKCAQIHTIKLIKSRIIHKA